MTQKQNYDLIEARLARIESHIALIEAMVLKLDAAVSRLPPRVAPPSAGSVCGVDAAPCNAHSARSACEYSSDEEDVAFGPTDVVASVVARRRTLV